MSRPITVTHPLYKREYSTPVIKDTIQEHLQNKLGVEMKVSILSENSVKVDFNKRLGSSKDASRDRVKESLIKLLQEEFGIDPIITRDSSAYNITLFEQEEPEDHVTKREVEDESNVILDSRFIWFFNILNRDLDTLVEMLETLEDAIDKVVELPNAKFIVANPYIDPDPSNPDVDLLFADNPGPVIIYDGVTAKDVVAEPQEETTQVSAIGSKVDYPQRKSNRPSRGKKRLKPKEMKFTEASSEDGDRTSLVTSIKDIMDDPNRVKLQVDNGKSDRVKAYNGFKQLMAKQDPFSARPTRDFISISLDLINLKLHKEVINIAAQLLRKLKEIQLNDPKVTNAQPMIDKVISTGKAFSTLVDQLKIDSDKELGKSVSDNSITLDSVADSIGIK